MKEVNKNMRMMEKSLAPLKFVAPLVAILLVGGAAHAQTQFASFTQLAGGNIPFRFINTGLGENTANPSRFGLYTSSGVADSIQVNFQFQTLNGYGSVPGANIPAIMTMTSQVDGSASLTNIFGASFVGQRLRNISITFTSLPTDPIAPNRNLLTVLATLNPPNSPPINPPGDPRNDGSYGTTATMSGQVGTSTLALQATESLGGSNYVGFSSDFLDFTEANQKFTNRNMVLSIGSVQPTVALGSNPPGSPDSIEYLRSFEAAMSGNFGSTPLPFAFPEPGTNALFVLGGMVATFGGVICRRKR